MENIIREKRMTTTYKNTEGKEVKLRTQSDDDLGTLVSVYVDGKMRNNFMTLESEENYHLNQRKNLKNNFDVEQSTEILAE